MTINSHIMAFAGKSVRDFDPEEGIKDPKGIAYRIGVDHDDTMTWGDKFAEFLEDEQSSKAESIVIGSWGEVAGDEENSSVVVDALVEVKDQVPNLKAIFLGDIVMEECEVSWIKHADISPLWSAFPKLTHFCVRGADGLSLGEFRHKNLRSFTIQCGGLGQEVLQEIAVSKLPELEHLELWLGDANYGADFDVYDVEPILSPSLFPKLISLGLKNSDDQDRIAKLVAKSGVIARIKILDLSMGTLTDAGAEALLNCPDLKNLELLDIHHHYVSPEMVKKLKSTGVTVDDSEPEKAERSDGEVWRFVSVGE